MTTVNLAPVIDDDGWNGTLTYLWEQVSGPFAAISSPTAAATDVELPDTQGYYAFRLTVSNDEFTSSAVSRIFLNLGAPTITLPYKGIKVYLDEEEIKILDGSLNINENKSGEANTATFKIRTTDPVPHVGQLVEIDRIDLVLSGGTGSIHEVTEHFSGDNVQTSFPLTYQLVLVNGVLGRGYVTYLGINETLSYVGGGGEWEYNTVTNSIERVSGTPDDSSPDNIEIIYSTTTYPDTGPTEEVSRIFAGVISADLHTYFEKRIIGFDEITCIDWNWLLMRRRFTKTYHNTQIATIAADLVAAVASLGVTLVLDVNLPTIPDISFRNATVLDAFAELCKQVPGLSARMDYSKAVHLTFYDTTVDSPLPINDVSQDLAFDIAVRRELTQSVNRVRAMGTGAAVRVGAQVGETRLFVTQLELPLPDIDGNPQPPRQIFKNASGQKALINGSQEITYQGTETGFINLAQNVLLTGPVKFGWQNIGLVAPTLDEDALYDNSNFPWKGPSFNGKGNLTSYEQIAYGISYVTDRAETGIVVGTGFVTVPGSAHAIWVPPIDVNSGAWGASTSIPPAPRIQQMNIYRTHNDAPGGFALFASLPPSGGLVINSESAADFADRIADGTAPSPPTDSNPANEPAYILDGVSGFTSPIKEGDNVNVFVIQNDVAAQTNLATLLGGSDDGVIEGYIEETSLTTTELEKFVTEYLKDNSPLTTSLTYNSFDRNSHPPRLVAVDLGEQDPIAGDFQIQKTTIGPFLQHGPPVHKVDSSPRRRGFEELLLGNRPANVSGGGSTSGGGGGGGTGTVGSPGGAGPIGATGATGAPGAPGPTVGLFAEVPTGLINGSNDVFTTSNPYTSGKLTVFLNGLKETDFTETTSTTFTLDDAPITGDVVEVIYV